MKRITYLLALGVVVGFCANVCAQDLKGLNVKTVEIKGLERISDQLVRSKLEVKPGQPYNAVAVARDIRRLYELGYFSSIKVDAAPAAGEVVVTYIVEEKRVIDEIKIIGNDKVRARVLRAALTWREGDSFVPEAYNDEREALLRAYEGKGFPNASVDILVEEVGPSRVRITYSIDEGKKARIRQVAFEGNETLSDRTLRKEMKTRRAWWFLGGKYNEETFEADLQNVVDKYGDYGRLEAEVADTEFQYSESGKRVDVTVRVKEGPEYRLDTLESSGNNVFDDDELVKATKVEAGDVHNKSQVEADAQTIQQGYRDSGYINAKVEPQVTLDREKKTTHVVQRVEEGDLKYVQEVKVTGNSVTRDDVIRREVLLLPSERFDGTLIEGSRRRLENTEYFDDVRFTLEDIEGSDEFSNLLVDVEEGKTGTFNFGAGYSTEEKFGGFGEVRLNNFDITNWPTFSGGGQQARLRLQLGDVRTQYNLSFTDPEIGGYPLAFGFDVFDESYEYEGGIDYTEDSTGGQIRLGKTLSPYVTARSSIRYRDSEISDVAYYKLSYVYHYQGGPTTVSSVWGINRNTLDSKKDPSTGSKHDLQLELATPAGDNEFYKLEQDSTWYWALDEDKKWVFSLRHREGWANEYGSSDFIPMADRFFVGGTSTVRGYDQRDIGPTAHRYMWFGEEERIGGSLELITNLELKYKVTKQLRLYAFVDSGGVWEEAGDFDLGDVKHGAGLGLGVDIPRMGPIRVDYGIPLNPDDDQGNGRLHLMTGFRF